MYKVITDFGVYPAKLKGSFLSKHRLLEDFPRVGDFVAIECKENLKMICGVLTRKNYLSKKVSGNRFDEQVIASNLDTVFIVMGLNQDYNIRRLERYVALLQYSGIHYVILLTKVDLNPKYLELMLECKRVGLTDDVFAISPLYEQNMDIFNVLIHPNGTYAFIGSSGTGKSTIINYLLHEQVQNTFELSSSNKGKHTTTSREMFFLPSGGIVIDTPGIKEIGLLDMDKEVHTSFIDIEELAKECRFANCTHTMEPKCMVKEMIESGLMEEGRLVSYHKLLKEAKYVERKLKIKEKLSKRRS